MLGRFYSSIFILILGSVFSNSSFASSAASEVFEKLKSKALNKSYDIEIAQASLDQKSSHLYTTVTKWFPHLDFQVSKNDTLDYSLVTSGALGNFGNTFAPQENLLNRWSLNLTLPIYQRSVQLGIEQGGIDKHLAEIELQSKKSEFEWKLFSYFTNYLLSSYQASTIEQSIEAGKKSLIEAKQRFELGQKTKVDVLRAEANLVSLDSKRITFEQSKQADYGSFLEYAGLETRDIKDSGLAELLGSETKISTALSQITETPNLDPLLDPYVPKPGDSQADEMVNHAIAHSSVTYQKYETQDDLSESQARTLMADEFPNLSLQGSLSKQSPDFNQTFTSQQVSHSVALVLTVPIFSGGSIISTYSEKNNAQRLSGLKREQDRIHFKNETSKNLLQILALRRTRESQTLSLSQNTEIVRLSRKSYELGKATIVELLGSENDLIDAKTNLAKTKVTLATLSRQLVSDLGIKK